MNKNIAIAGNIGSGKALLIDFLCTSYPSLRRIGNDQPNPFLEDFFADMKRWSFHSQVYLLSEKFRNLLAAREDFRSTIMQRSIYEDAEIFARDLYQTGSMSESEFRTYYNLFLSFIKLTTPPDLLIYLHSSIKTSLNRVCARRHGSFISESYLKRLNRLYVNWIADYDLSEVLIIDTDQLDFVGNLVDRADISDAVERYI